MLSYLGRSSICLKDFQFLLYPLAEYSLLEQWEILSRLGTTNGVIPELTAVYNPNFRCSGRT